MSGQALFRRLDLSFRHFCSSRTTSSFGTFSVLVVLLFAALCALWARGRNSTHNRQVLSKREPFARRTRYGGEIRTNHDS